MKKLLILALAAVVLPMQATALELRASLTDSMVVQRNSKVIIDGTGAMGAVTAQASWLPGVKLAAQRHGKDAFAVEIPTPDAGGPYTISISDKNESITLGDVYSGELWLCSGQSNMEMPLAGWGQVQDYEAEIADAANYPLIRMLKIEHTTAGTPQEEVKTRGGGWHAAAPGTVDEFSAVAYFFARELQTQLDGIPVGVIDCSWAGTPAEAWTPLEACREIGLNTTGVDDSDATRRAFDKYHADIEAFKQLRKEASDFDLAALQSGWKTTTLPGYWENDILPDFDGIVWFQKEVTVPEGMRGKELQLSLGAIDDEDVTYVNGKKVGSSKSYNKDRLYTIPASLATDKLVITIQVTDNAQGGGFAGKADDMKITDGTPGHSIALHGPWQYKVAVDYAVNPLPKAPYDHHSPATLYNGMLHTLHNTVPAGVLWYQGCSNVGRDEQYSRLFPRMITEWRKLLGREDLPFYFVQLAGYLKPRQIQPESEWAALRQAQTAALQLPATGMATAIDIGNATDIHPKNKQEVARRLALQALNKTYGQAESFNADAPKPQITGFNGLEANITFTAPVVPVGGRPRGFIVRLPDGSWIRPKTECYGELPETVWLKAPAQIMEIRYDWADYPDGNLYGTDGLPVLPFKASIP